MNREESQHFMTLKRQGDFEGAVSLLQPTISELENTPQKWHALSVLAIFAIDEGYFDQALIYCFDLEEMDPTDASVHDLKGIIYRLKGDLIQSEREFRRSLELTPRDTTGNHFVAITTLGEALLATGRLDECEKLCTSDWNPDDAVLLDGSNKGESMQVGNRLLLLARLAHKQKKFSQSIDFFRRTIRLHRAMRTFIIDSNALLEELASVIYEAEQSQSNQKS